jgi:hypothetical protein
MPSSVALAILAALASSGKPYATTRHSVGFVAAIVAIARDGRITDPRLVQARTGIPLRNPQKYTDQPRGSPRNADWHWPPNRWGIAEIRLDEQGSADRAKTGMTLDLTLTGRPCLSIRDLERAAGRRARFGGIDFAPPPATDGGPSSGPIQISDKHASLVVRSRRGADVTLTAESTRPRRAGCIRSLTLQTERPRP